MNSIPSGPLSLQEAVEAQLTEADTPQGEADTPAEPDRQAETTQAPDTPETEAEPPTEEPEAPEDGEEEPEGELEAADPGEPEPEAEYEELGPETSLFEVDGEPITLKEARDGYLRQADYTRSRQKTAQLEKERAAELEQLRDHRERYAKGLETLEEALKADGEAVDDSYLDELWDNDPGLARKLERERTNRDERLKAVQTERARMDAERQAEHQNQLRSYISQEQTKLAQALPEWKDAELAAKEKAGISAYLQERGYSQDEISQLYDHRLILVLRDALQGRRIEKEKPNVVKKVAKVRKMMKPAGRRGKTAAKRDRVSQAEVRLSTSGEMEDAIALQLARMGGAK